MFLFLRLKKRYNLQYPELRDVASNIRGHAHQGLRSPSRSSQSNYSSGDQEPVIHPDSGNTLLGSNADPIANKKNEVTLPDPVSVSSKRTPDKTPSSDLRSKLKKKPSFEDRLSFPREKLNHIEEEGKAEEYVEPSRSADKSNQSPNMSDGKSLS